MTATISRLYNNYADAREAVRNLEAAGVGHNDINIIASNADNWYSSDRKAGKDTFPDRDLDGKDDRAEAAGAGAGVGAGVAGGPFPALVLWSPPDGWRPRLPAPRPEALPGASWAPSRRPASARRMPISTLKDCGAWARASARGCRARMPRGCKPSWIGPL